MRGARPFGFTDLSRGKGLDEVIDFIVENGGLAHERDEARRLTPLALDQHFVIAAPIERAACSLETEDRPMNVAQLSKDQRSNLPFYDERVDLACAFRWTARLNMHEAVANHFSLAVNDDGSHS